LAFTSNNWSAKQLRGNWKKLHSLTYLVIFLLPWHIWVRMGGHWSHITPFALLLTIVTAILFIIRRWIEQLEARSKQISQPETKLLGDK
jgi:sulfoxide reductase heme-binding subunit YedZ